MAENFEEDLEAGLSAQWLKQMRPSGTCLPGKVPQHGPGVVDPRALQDPRRDAQDLEVNTVAEDLEAENPHGLWDLPGPPKCLMASEVLPIQTLVFARTSKVPLGFRGPGHSEIATHW